MDVDNSKNSSRRLSKPVRITEQIWPDDVLPLVSICCFTYNHKDFIEEAIEGFLMQETTFPVEIIIRDDASTDGTSQIIKNYSKKYPQIIKPILLAENQYSQRREAFTKIHSVARGNYIALCEGDDYWTEPTKLQKQLFLLEQNSTSSFCFHNTLIVNQKMQVSGQLRPNTASLMHSVEELVGSNFIHTSSIVFRKSMRPEFPEWYSKAPMGDWPFCILLAEKGNFLYINEVMSHYRLHGQSSWSSQSQAIRCAKTVHLFDLLKDHFAKKPELLAKVNKGFIMHCLNAAKEFKNLNDAENANFFHEKIIEALTGIELSERVKVRHPGETYKESIDSIKTPQAQVESKAKEDAPLVSVCIPTFNGELFIKINSPISYLANLF